MVTFAAPEIWDEIIDYFARDRRTLIQTSLTCRMWLPRSRKHLFDKINLVSEHGQRRFEALVSASSSSIAASPSASLSITPAVQYVHHLELHLPLSTTSTRQRDLSNQHEETEVDDTLQQLISILRPLINLKSLSLWAEHYPQSMRRYEFPANKCGHILSNLETLWLFYSTFHSPDTVTSLLTAFPRLTRLELFQPEDAMNCILPVSPLMSDDLQSSDTVQIAPIKELNLDNVPGSVGTIIAEILGGTPSALSLSVLYIDIPNEQMGSKTPLSDLCVACGPSLEELHIRVAGLEISTYRGPDTLEGFEHGRVPTQY